MTSENNAKSDSVTSESTKLSSRRSLFAGLRQKCPNCGKGNMFRSYLKLQDNCPHCNESLGEFRADDGPAWLAMFLSGHIIIPALFYMEANQQFPIWQEILILIALACTSVYFLLPRAKGLFVAMLWLMEKKHQSQSHITS